MKKAIGLFLVGAAAAALAACSPGGGTEEKGTETITAVVVTTAEDDKAAAETTPESPADTEDETEEVETVGPTQASSEPESSAQEETEEETTEFPEINLEAETPLYSEAEPSHDVVLSPAGDGLTQAVHPNEYQLEFDASMFDLVETNGMDSYEYRGEAALPVYMTVQMMSGMSADDLINGLVLQTGRDDLQVQDGYIGADSVPARLLYMETPVNGMTQIQMFYVIEQYDGSILIEAGSYGGVGELVDSAMETMMGTFTLQ